MSRTTNRRITAAGLLAGAVLLLATLAANAPWASARAADSAEVLASDDAAQCGGADVSSVDAAVAQLQQDLLAAQQGEPDLEDGSGYVVLNNRGYNYGPPPGVRFDPLLLELEAKANERAR